MECFVFPFRREAGLEMEGRFLIRFVYDDAVSYDLVGAASKVLSKSCFIKCSVEFNIMIWHKRG